MLNLPDKLSELIRVAVADCQKVETMSNYQFDMRYWMSFHESDICSVCMAGAVMVCSLADTTKSYPHQFPNNINNKLLAINDIRLGNVFEAINQLTDLLEDKNYDISCISSIETFIKDNYDLFLRRAGWDTYLKVADMLEVLYF